LVAKASDGLISRLFWIVDISRMYRIVIIPSQPSSSFISKESGIAIAKVPRNNVLSSSTNHHERINGIMDYPIGLGDLRVDADSGTFLLLRIIKTGGDARFTKLKRKVIYPQ
jgi:hypothetical protein